MQISDDLMFRYYELLTDRSMAEIQTMRERILAGQLHPMDAKIDLGKLIVTDFHSAAEAGSAAAEFNRVVRRREIPADIPVLRLPDGVRAGAGVRVDKMLPKIGLADSVSDATRKIKAGAVEINGERVRGLALAADGTEWIVQVGKNWRRVTLT
jgi:tyrosyl-tRNA synthetase